MRWSKTQLIEKRCVIVQLRDKAQCDEWVLRSEAEKRIKELEADRDHYKQRVQDLRTCKVCGQDKVIAEIGAAFGYRPDIMGLKLQELQRKYEALAAKRDELKRLVDEFIATLKTQRGKMIPVDDLLRALREADDE